MRYFCVENVSSHFLSEKKNTSILDFMCTMRFNKCLVDDCVQAIMLEHLCCDSQSWLKIL